MIAVLDIIVNTLDYGIRSFYMDNVITLMIAKLLISYIYKTKKRKIR